MIFKVWFIGLLVFWEARSLKGVENHPVCDCKPRWCSFMEKLASTCIFLLVWYIEAQYYYYWMAIFLNPDRICLWSLLLFEVGLGNRGRVFIWWVCWVCSCRGSKLGIHNMANSYLSTRNKKNGTYYRNCSRVTVSFCPKEHLNLQSSHKYNRSF